MIRVIQADGQHISICWSSFKTLCSKLKSQVLNMDPACVHSVALPQPLSTLKRAASAAYFPTLALPRSGPKG